jgi:hypothetical protein
MRRKLRFILIMLSIALLALQDVPVLSALWTAVCI